MQIPSFVGTGLLVLASVLAGGTGHFWWARHERRARRRIPRHWPLDPRPIANSRELQVWRWLVRAFPGHAIMVKLPITRFTAPHASEDSLLLYELLSKVYCTFSVCTPAGKVIGCVDVRGGKAVSRSNQLLKLGLLSQCGICYWIIEPGALPDPKEVRAYFLAEEAQTETEPAGGQALTSAKVQLRAAVERQRHHRQSSREQAAKDAAMKLIAAGDEAESDFARGAWQQADSFIAPLADSRLSPLH